MFINGIWLNVMPTCKATFLPEGISYHCPAKIVLNEINIKTRKTLYYSNVWAQHPFFREGPGSVG